MGTTHTSQQLIEFLELLKNKGMTPNRFTKMLESGILADVVDKNACLTNRATVRVALKLDLVLVPPDIFRLTVDYSQSPEQMISTGLDDWKDDWKNDANTVKHFPIRGKGVVEFEARYFYFVDRNISSKNALTEIRAADPKNPWSVAKIEHLLSHRKTFQEEVGPPILGLGSVAKINGHRHVPGLFPNGSGRCLFLWLFEYDLPYQYHRSLAVRPVRKVLAP